MKAAAAQMMWPVALERDIGPTSLARAGLGSLELVVWRCEEGQIRVWEDHCPHRSVRLSAGRNLGTCLEEAYHGWRFGADGRLSFIPAEQHQPLPDIRVSVLASRLQSGLVWAGAAPDAELPQGFEIAPHEVLIRPLPFEAAVERVEAACRGVPDLRAIVTPTREGAVVYGFADGRADRNKIDTLKRVNAALTQLRYRIEALP